MIAEANVREVVIDCLMGVFPAAVICHKADNQPQNNAQYDPGVWLGESVEKKAGNLVEGHFFLSYKIESGVFLY